MQVHEKILNTIMDDSEISWKTIIYQLVQDEGMDPSDLDVGRISKEYVNVVKKAQKHDLKLSGKVILAAAYLLKIKSISVLDNSLDAFKNLIEPEKAEDINADDENRPLAPRKNIDYSTLVPRIPQPRKRKVSVQDLVNALEKALEVKERRVRNYVKRNENDIDVPEAEYDISEMIDRLYKRIDSHYSKKEEELYFHHLLDSQKTMDKVITFLPLLHLENQTKIVLSQKKHCGDIVISKRDEAVNDSD